MEDPQTIVREGYRERRQAFHSQQLQWQQYAKRLRLARLAAFLTALISLGFAYEQTGLTARLICAVSFAAFAALVIYHDWIERQERRAKHLVWLQDCGLARIDRRWTQLAAGPLDRSLPDELLALDSDLDITGKVSLFRLCSSTSTRLGQRTLLDWLSSPTSIEQIKERQQAVQELASKREVCEEIHVRGALMGLGATDPLAFFEWAEGPAWLEKRPWLLWLSRLVPLALVAVFITILSTNLLPDAVAALMLVILVLANGALSVSMTGSVHDIFGRISSKEGEVQQYGELFELLRNYSLDSPRLQQLQSQIAEDISRRLARLNRIMRAANLRNSGLFGVLYFGLQIIFLWDFHALWFLERWQKDNGQYVREWFVALAEWESLASLATLSHDHPHWCFPDVNEKHGQFSAEQMGHPHLAFDECVTNDVCVGPRGQFLLVTGSNMSGKSTLLRSIGVNSLLAQAGGPVCASRLSMPRMRLHTSMRIRDSLAEGTSFYMAELKRLKEIVDRTADETEANPFFLLDEILQGTNSGERHIAVSRVVSQLLRTGAMGAISTHDLELANSGELKPHCDVIHFRESFEQVDGQRKMTFDYQLRPGVAPTTNALELLRLVGIEKD